jgi:hypothetical protein
MQAMLFSSSMLSRYALAILALGIGSSEVANAQARIYRCGNAYTNSPTSTQLPNCKLVEGGNLTVVQTTKSTSVATSKPAKSAASAAPAKGAEASSEQRARDSDAKVILADELSKAEQKLTELLKEYNNGEPEKLGPEHRNHQKYLDRVSEMKNSIDRATSDIDGIKREISRLGPR